MLRRAREEDAERIAALFSASRDEAMPWLPVLHTADENQRFFTRTIRDQEVWVAEVEGEVAGFAALDDHFLNHLYVAPERQGRGVGGALFARAGELRPNGFRFWVFQRNERARRFYEARGCRVVELTDGSANEEREPDALYELSPGRAPAAAARAPSAR